ncbi:MAG: hypothetical protein JNM43_13425 [Planctomycetaceae bacterium]|nr:hypothetical protein [Planctomycetaceae bacterium]
MQWSDVRRPVTAKTSQQFGFLLAAVIFVVSLRESWKHGLTGFSLTIAVLAVGAALVAWSKPLVYRPIFTIWMILVFPIGWMMSKLVLLTLYFLVLTPIGLLLRWRGHDPLALAASSERTLWWKRPVVTRPSQYLRQY